jgi:Toprim domain-containing protein
MKLTLDRLEKVRTRGTKIIARCPACAETGGDRTGDNLAIFADGNFACAAYQQDRGHSRRILQLAGKKERHHADSRPDFPPPMRRHTPVQTALPPDFADLTRAARWRAYNNQETQAAIAAEFGVRAETIRILTTCSSGGIGFFPSISIGGRPCLPGRIGYIYPAGIKIRHPWGPGSRVRFAWACGSATEPWRHTLAGWRSWVRHYIITEGESDLIALVDAKIEDLSPGGGTAVVASPGTSFREEWAPLFTGRTVTLLMDADDAGAAATRRIAAMLRPHAAQIRIFNHTTPYHERHALHS